MVAIGAVMNHGRAFNGDAEWRHTRAILNWERVVMNDTQSAPTFQSRGEWICGVIYILTPGVNRLEAECGCECFWYLGGGDNLRSSVP